MPVHAHPGVPDEQARPVVVPSSAKRSPGRIWPSAVTQHWASVDTTIAPELLVSSLNLWRNWTWAL